MQRGAGEGAIERCLSGQGGGHRLSTHKHRSRKGTNSVLFVPKPKVRPTVHPLLRTPQASIADFPL